MNTDVSILEEFRSWIDLIRSSFETLLDKSREMVQVAEDKQKAVSELYQEIIKKSTHIDSLEIESNLIKIEEFVNESHLNFKALFDREEALKDLSERVSHFDNQIKSLQSSINDQVQFCLTQMNEVSTKIISLEHQIPELKSSKYTLLEKCKKMQEDLKALDQKFIDLKNDLNNKINQISSLANKNEQIEASLNNLLAATSGFNHITIINDKIHLLNETSNKLDQEQKLQANSLGQVRIEIQELRSQKSEIFKTFNDMYNDYNNKIIKEIDLYNDRNQKNITKIENQLQDLSDSSKIKKNISFKLIILITFSTVFGSCLFSMMIIYFSCNIPILQRNLSCDVYKR